MKVKVIVKSNSVAIVYWVSERIQVASLSHQVVSLEATRQLASGMTEAAGMLQVVEQWAGVGSRAVWVQRSLQIHATCLNSSALQPVSLGVLSDEVQHRSTTNLQGLSSQAMVLPEHAVIKQLRPCLTTAIQAASLGCSCRLTADMYAVERQRLGPVQDAQAQCTYSRTYKALHTCRFDMTAFC